MPHAFDCKLKGRLGEEDGDLKEARVLNRILRIKPEGWEYEADQRHAELVVRGLGMEKAKCVKIPSEEIPGRKMEEDENLNEDKLRFVVDLLTAANFNEKEFLLEKAVG